MARQIIFRQIRAIGRRRIVRADHRDRAVVAFPSEHIGGRQSGAPPPRMMTDDGVCRAWVETAGDDRGSASFSRTNAVSP
jgi:hypothetical protein